MSRAQGSRGRLPWGNVAAPVKDPNDVLMSDTNPFNGMEDYPRWEDIYRIFTHEDFPEDDEDIRVYRNIRKSGLHAIAARPAILPYNDAVRWIFSHLDYETAIVTNELKAPIASLRPEDINTRYHLQTPEVRLNKDFLDTFSERHPDLAELIREWWVEDKDFTVKGVRLYLIQHLKPPYRLLAVMICRLYGEETSTHFRLEWTTLAYTVAEAGEIFNWAQILSANIFRTAKTAPGLKKPGFYMSSYLIDAVCSSLRFPQMGWKWNSNLPPIHVYCSELWEANYKRHLYNICDNFLAPLYSIIYNQNPPRLSLEAIEALKDIGDWYMGKHYTYIRIFGCTKAPHLLPKYIPEKLLGREIAYQTVDVGITPFFVANNKKIWPRFPIKVGRFTLLNVPHAKKEVADLKELCLCTGEARKYDPKGIVKEHIRSTGLAQSVEHEENVSEDILRGALFFQEVLNRIPDGLAREKLQKLEEEKKEKILEQWQQVLLTDKQKEEDKKAEAAKDEEIYKKARDAEKRFQRKEKQKAEEEAKRQAEEEKERKGKEEEQRKEEELAEFEREKKRKLEENLNKENSTSNVTEITLLNSPINPGTFLSTIPTPFAYSSLVTEFEDVVVAVGDYYHSKSKRGVEKRAAKRKRLGEGPAGGSSGRDILWKLGPNLQINAIDTASALSAFAGANNVTVVELNAMLDSYKERVAELEEGLNLQKIQLEGDSRQQVTVMEQLHKLEVDNLKKEHALEMINLKTEHKEKVVLSEQQRLKIIEYGEKIQSLKQKLKDNKQEGHAMESIKGEAIKTNEELKEVRTSFFTQLNIIQDHYEEINSLSDQLDDLDIKYTEAGNAFADIIDWQERFKEAPADLFRFTKKEQGKTQLFLNSWKDTHQDIRGTIASINEACAKMWRSADELREQFNMPDKEEFTQAHLSKLRIKRAEEDRNKSKQEIENLTNINTDILKQYLIQPIKQAIVTKEFVNRIHKDLQREVVDRVCDAELELEKMKLNRLEELTKAHDSWKTFKGDST